MSNKVLYESEDTRIEYFTHDENVKSKLVFIFSPSYNRSLDGNPYGGEIFFRHGYDVISIKKIKDDWYQNFTDELFTLISNSFIQDYGYRVGFGSSMGGYACIAFSDKLQLDTAIVYSPQFAIDQSFDVRWQDYASNINFRHCIDEKSISKKTKFNLVFDNKSLDALHIEKICELLPHENIALVRLPFAGHPVTNYLQDIGAMKDLPIMIAEGADIQGLFNKSKKLLSKSYFSSLARELLRRNKPLLALQVIERFINLDPESSAGLHGQKSDIFFKIGRVKDALDSLRKAVQIAPFNPHILGQLSRALLDNNLFDEALSLADRAISFDKNIIGLHIIKIEILRRMGQPMKGIDACLFALSISPNNHELLKRLSDLKLTV